jgi:hypothetical protein
MRTKLHEAIHFLVNFFNERGDILTFDRLVLHLYMVECNMQRYLGRQLCNLHWIVTEKGPYAAEIRNALDDLIEEGLIGYKDTIQANQG